MQRSVVALRTAFALFALALIAACSGQQGAQQRQEQAASPGPVRNPVDFPLYPGAHVLSAHPFTQVVQADNAGGQSVFTAGNGTYRGHEVIASSSAEFAQLSDWVGQVAASPPPGYSAMETGENPQERTQAARYGFDYAAFVKTANGHKTGVLVIALDPQQMNKRFGAVLGMIAKYRSLPAVMRQPIDEQAKARIGMTLSEATQPNSPIGAALAALDQFENTNSRGIVLLDATKH
jgi:hypothetical protein